MQDMRREKMEEKKAERVRTWVARRQERTAAADESGNGRPWMDWWMDGCTEGWMSGWIGEGRKQEAGPLEPLDSDRSSSPLFRPTSLLPSLQWGC